MKIKTLILALPIYLLLNSCTKNHMGEEAGENILSNENNKPRSNNPVLFYSYQSNKNNGNGMIATTNIMSGTSNFSFQATTPTRPTFHVFNKTTGELWGIRFSKQFSKKTLTKYSVSNKTFTDVDIFPLDSLQREIIKVDEAAQKIYYLEGLPSSIGFYKLASCNFDGSATKNLIENYGDILAAAIAKNKIYYVSKASNALMEKPINGNSIKVLIKNFSLAGTRQFADFAEVTIANKKFWSVQRVYNPIDERRLNLFDIDTVTNTIFWLRDAVGLVSFVNNEPKAVRYNLVRPDLVSCKLDGTGFTLLNIKFSNTLGIPGQDGDIAIVRHGGLQIDAGAKKLYFGIEKIIQSKNTPQSPFPGDVLPVAGFYRTFNIYQTDFFGNNSKKLLKANGQDIIYPLQWEPLTTTQIIDWPYTSNTLFKGSLESFILGSME